MLALFNPLRRMYDLAGNPSAVDIATQIIIFEGSKENFQFFCSPLTMHQDVTFRFTANFS